LHALPILAHGRAPAGQNRAMPYRRLAFVLLALLLAAALRPGWAAEQDVERGRRLIAQHQCGACHTIPGVASAEGRVAQPLAGWKHRSYIAGRVPNRAAALAQWIAAPQSLVPGTAMPSMGVGAADAHAMAAYLLSLE
jgi:cytochrome c